MPRSGRGFPCRTRLRTTLVPDDGGCVIENGVNLKMPLTAIYTTTTSSVAHARPGYRWSCCMALAAMSTNSCRSQPIGAGSPILAVRGGIPFDGGFAFFHRLPDRSIDEADIASRAVILADFIGAASTQYRLSRAPIAIGFSNGAIMAAALLLTRPGLLAGAILCRRRSGMTC